MKNLLFVLVFTSIFAEVPDIRLLDYQEKYSVCQEKTNYQIAQCLLNGNLNYSGFRGDKHSFRTIDKESIKTAVQNDDIYNYTMSLMPQTRRYIFLKEYIDYLYSIKNEYIPPQFKGDEAQDIINIKKVFNLLQFASLEENSDYTQEFEAELLKYQKRHGLEVDGKIGPGTKRELKRSIDEIIIKAKKNLTLERLFVSKGSNYVLVNIPEFKMHYYDNGEQILDMKVIVGKRSTRTPILNGMMQYIVKNPIWNVPQAIYVNEYANKSKGYLKRNGFAYNSEGRLYQKKGKGNALGVVKFLFPNRFNVYMHDTPTKSLFDRRIRTFSHGCIRLEKPIALLNELGFDYDTKRTKWITLERQIPVYVEYHTLWVDDEGVVQFRDDIYGYEERLFR